MDQRSFDEHREKEGWSDDDEDDSKNGASESLSFGMLLVTFSPTALDRSLPTTYNFCSPSASVSDAMLLPH